MQRHKNYWDLNNRTSLRATWSVTSNRVALVKKSNTTHHFSLHLSAHNLSHLKKKKQHISLSLWLKLIPNPLGSTQVIAILTHSPGKCSSTMGLRLRTGPPLVMGQVFITRNRVDHLRSPIHIQKLYIIIRFDMGLKILSSRWGNRSYFAKSLFSKMGQAEPHFYKKSKNRQKCVSHLFKKYSIMLD